MIHPLQEILEKRFGFSSFREGQLDILRSVLNRKDALAVMPTGRGKSLCYQIPAVHFEGITIVVSPLIALMRDQAEALRQKGIVAGCLYSGQSVAEKKRVFAELANAKSSLLYLSPERVQKEGFSQWIQGKNISLFAIDESHCVSKWGPDFRPDYHKLDLLRQLRPEVPILALTATATPTVLRDIEKRLGLRTPDRHVHGFYRPNLYYQVQACEKDTDKYPYIHQAVKQNPTGKILIYCGTRQLCEDLAGQLRKAFSNVGFYHAGMKTEEREKIQDDFGAGKIRILTATNAFGMGIDHPDVRLVVHGQMPANIESYYQEVGRAGRDGAHSTCLLLYSKKDRALQIFFIRESKADDFTIKQRWRALDTMTQFAEGGECRHAGILTYFRDSQRLKACGHCDVCDPESSRRIQSPAPMLSSHISKKSQTRKSKPSKKGFSTDALSNEAKVRMDVLREWRKTYADAHDIPAFLVFSNKTLQDLAVKAPTTSEELMEIYGMGPHKVEHLGPEILSQLRSTQLR